MASAKSRNSASTVTDPSAMQTMIPVANQAWLNMANECARFTRARLQQNLAAQRALLSCKTPMDVLRQSVGHSHATSQDYAEHSSKLIQMALQTTWWGGSQARYSSSRAYDDIPL